nr:glycosyltransferase [uncultured Mucilaginibacter sp.]
MKIFLSFLQSQKKHPIPAYDFWQYYIKNGIEEAGYEWEEHSDIDWAKGLVPQSKVDLANWKEEAWSKTVKRLKEQPVDLFLSYLYPEQIDKSAIQEIKKMGVPCVNFYCDNVRQFSILPDQFGVFDLNWVPEYKAVKMYQEAGYSHINVPMPMWILPEMRIPRSEHNQQVTFIGSKDVQRSRLFEQVLKKSPDIDLSIYGAGWSNDASRQPPLSSENSTITKFINQFKFISHQGLMAYMHKIAQRNTDTAPSEALKAKAKGPIDFDTYNKLTTESMITVGVNRYPSFRFPLNRPNTYSRLRDIEAPMLGACYLTEYTQGLEELYDIGKEIAVYKDADDLIEKVDELKKNSTLRKTLRSEGQKRALTNHTIPQSLNKILQALK